MQLKSKTIPVLILTTTALALSSAVLALFRDPEGPNLVVVIGLAAVINVLSLTFYLTNAIRTLTNPKRLIVAFIIQVLVATGLFFVLR